MALHANKIAIVTGASQGIGLAIAKRLGLDGAKVVICSRKETKVQEAVEKLRSNGVTVEGTPCHVGLETDRQKLVDFTLEKYGKIDYLISNAGINPHYGDLLDLFEVNVKAGFLLSKLVVPHMEKVGMSRYTSLPWCPRFKYRCGDVNAISVNSYCKKTCGTCTEDGGDKTDAPPEQPTKKPGPEPTEKPGPEPTEKLGEPTGELKPETSGEPEPSERPPHPPEV